MIELLLAAKASVNAKSDTWETPLHFAAISNSVSVAELLLTAGAQVSIKAKVSFRPNLARCWLIRGLLVLGN